MPSSNANQTLGRVPNEVTGVGAETRVLKRFRKQRPGLVSQQEASEEVPWMSLRIDRLDVGIFSCEPLPPSHLRPRKMVSWDREPSLECFKMLDLKLLIKESHQQNIKYR